jgi:L-2,4-diaminobutyric acid acetyltransferase
MELRRPHARDGAAAFRLIARCPPLDVNSRYCNVLQCSHFADSSVIATLDDEAVGFLAGYLVPSRNDTLFVWQVAVAPECRRQRLFGAMIEHVLQRRACRHVRYIEASITPDNEASWRSFDSVARGLGAALATGPWLSSERHFDGEHASEALVRIGPLARAHDTEWRMTDEHLRATRIDRL